MSIYLSSLLNQSRNVSAILEICQKIKYLIRFDCVEMVQYFCNTIFVWISNLENLKYYTWLHFYNMPRMFFFIWIECFDFRLAKKKSLCGLCFPAGGIIKTLDGCVLPKFEFSNVFSFALFRTFYWQLN